MHKTMRMHYFYLTLVNIFFFVLSDFMDIKWLCLQINRGKWLPLITFFTRSALMICIFGGKTENMSAKSDLEFTMTYKESVDGGYVGIINEVPGVASQGETISELEANLGDALRCMMHAMRQISTFPLGVDTKTRGIKIAC